MGALCAPGMAAADRTGTHRPPTTGVGPDYTIKTVRLWVELNHPIKQSAFGYNLTTKGG